MRLFRFDEYDNFHKLEIINEDVRRIKQVLEVKESEMTVECSLVPAMILSRIGIKCVEDKKVANMIGILNKIVDLE